jgi:citrate synthase
MSSKIDRAESDEEGIRMYINYGRHDSKGVNWVSLESLFQDHDFLDLLFVKLGGKKPSSEERGLLLKTLMLVSMGVGHDPPSVFIPKTIASTTKDERFAVINGLIGGLASFGTHHLGAIYDVMGLYKELRGADVEEYVERRLGNGECIPGFGHPAYREDPRPSLLSKELDRNFADSPDWRNYSHLERVLLERKGLYPNIDAITGISFTCLGFQPAHGVYLSFTARSLSMLCHVLEEGERKAFSFFLEHTRAESNKGDKKK